MRFSARREPDLYNDYLVGLLKHADLAALRGGRGVRGGARPDEETDRGEDRGKVVQVSRYCPHASEDLAETGVVVEPGSCRASGTTSTSTSRPAHA